MVMVLLCDEATSSDGELFVDRCDCRLNQESVWPISAVYTGRNRPCQFRHGKLSKERQEPDVLTSNLLACQVSAARAGKWLLATSTVYQLLLRVFLLAADSDRVVLRVLWARASLSAHGRGEA
jgi:hypothetical protein